MADISQGQALQTARSVGGFQMPSGSVALTPLQLVALIKLGRNAGLEEAKQKCKQLEVAIDGAGNTYYRPADARQCVAAIESLKDNTP